MAYPDTHLLYQKWAQEYGPIFSIILGTKVMMIVSDDETVKELIDRRGAIASARPDMYIGAELASGGFRAGFEVSSFKYAQERLILIFETSPINQSGARFVCQLMRLYESTDNTIAAKDQPHWA